VHVRYLERETAFQFVVCGDGKPWWRVPLEPRNSATTKSPFVVLAGRS
jgi:hypothetical protein